MNDIPAFPVGSGYMRGPHGMSLRDYFAAKVMQAHLPHDGTDEVNEAGVAKWAYEMADAMLIARRHDD